MSELPAKPDSDSFARKIVESITGAIARIPTTEMTESSMPAEAARNIAR